MGVEGNGAQLYLLEILTKLVVEGLHSMFFSSQDVVTTLLTVDEDRHPPFLSLY